MVFPTLANNQLEAGDTPAIALITASLSSIFPDGTTLID